MTESTAKPAMLSLSKYTLIIIDINIVLYALCYHLQRPVEPFLVEKLELGKDANAAESYAKLQSVMQLIQVIGSLFIGKLLDRFGSKIGFIMSFVSSAISYGILANSTTIYSLYFSKIPTMFQAAFLCAQVASAQATTDGAERVLAFSRLTLAYTIGTIIGPALGGWLGSDGDYYLSAKLAVAGSILSIILTLFMPNTGINKIETEKKTDDDEIIISSETTKSETIFEIITLVWVLLTTKLITGIANSMMSTAFPLVLKDIYELNETQVGTSMSILSIANAISTIFLVPPLLLYTKGRLMTIVTMCLIGMSTFFFTTSMIETPFLTLLLPLPFHRYFIFMSISVILSIMQYILATTLTGESTTRVGIHSKGMLLGLEHSLFAAARIGSPQVGVYLLQYGGLTAVGGGCGVVFASVTLCWWWFETKLIKDNIKDNHRQPIERKEK